MLLETNSTQLELDLESYVNKKLRKHLTPEQYFYAYMTNQLMLLPHRGKELLIDNIQWLSGELDIEPILIDGRVCISITYKRTHLVHVKLSTIPVTPRKWKAFKGYITGLFAQCVHYELNAVAPHIRSSIHAMLSNLSKDAWDFINDAVTGHLNDDTEAIADAIHLSHCHNDGHVNINFYDSASDTTIRIGEVPARSLSFHGRTNTRSIAIMLTEELYGDRSTPVTTIPGGNTHKENNNETN